MKARNEKLPEKKELREEKAGAVDQIKKKYGFPASGVSTYPERVFFLLI